MLIVIHIGSDVLLRRYFLLASILSISVGSTSKISHRWNKGRNIYKYTNVFMVIDMNNSLLIIEQWNDGDP